MIVRFYFLIIFSSFTLITFSSCAQHKATTASVVNTANVDYKKMQQDILYYVNKHRKEKGLAALTMNNIACEEALQHSKDMANRKVDFSHDGFYDRMKDVKAKMGPVCGFAENVAYGKIGAKEVVDMWLDSPGHRENIEGDYALMGIGIARSNDGYLYFTQIFILK